MQIKVRTRCENPTCKMYTTCPGCRGTGWGDEEWESADVIFSGLNECITQLAERVERLETSFRNVAIIDVNNRIERLEGMSTEDNREWCPCPHDMYPIGGCDCVCHQAALEREHEADLAQEWYEEQLDEAELSEEEAWAWIEDVEGREY